MRSEEWCSPFDLILKNRSNVVYPNFQVHVGLKLALDLLEFELLNSGFIRDDGAALHFNLVLLDRLSILEGDLVISGISAFDAQVVVLDIDVKEWKDQLFQISYNSRLDEHSLEALLDLLLDGVSTGETTRSAVLDSLPQLRMIYLHQNSIIKIRAHHLILKNSSEMIDHQVWMICTQWS